MLVEEILKNCTLYSTHVLNIVNKRLDEWVGIENFDLRKLKKKASKKKKKKSAIIEIPTGKGEKNRKVTRNMKRKYDEISGVNVKKNATLFLFVNFLTLLKFPATGKRAPRRGDQSEEHSDYRAWKV